MKIGGRSRTRTYGPLIKSQLLYQLSYAPDPHRSFKLSQKTTMWFFIASEFRPVKTLSQENRASNFLDSVIFACRARI